MNIARRTVMHCNHRRRHAGLLALANERNVLHPEMRQTVVIAVTGPLR
jgi:hypothetical protein